MADYAIDRTEELDDRSSRNPACGRHAVVVAGMHRSGTSAFARVLGFLGAALPAHAAEPGRDNQGGSWEPLPIRQLDDELLATAESRWDDVAADPPSWFASDALAPYVERAAALLDAEYEDHRLFVLKDPRICRLLPFWQQVFVRAGVAPGYVLPIRNPLEIAASLRSRDGFSMSKSLLLWLEYVIEAERWTRGARRSIVQYEELLRDWPAVTNRIAEDLDLAWPQTSHRARIEIERFLAQELRHHVFADHELAARADIAGWVRRVYGAMLTLASEDASMGDEYHTLDQVAAEFHDADALYGPVIAGLELDLEAARAAERAIRESLDAQTAEVRELERARHSLRVQLEARTAAVTSLENDRQDLREQLAAAVVEQQRQSDELEARRAAHIEDLNEVGRVRAELESSRRELASLHDASAREQESARTQLASAARELEHLQGELEKQRAEHSASLLELERRSLRGRLARLRRWPLLKLSLLWVAVVPAGARLRLRYASQLGSWLVRPTPMRLGWVRAYFSLRRSRAFDYQFYVDRYPDVVRARMNPLMHYIEHGALEGRDPSARFSTAAYLAGHPDLNPRRRNPLYEAHRRGDALAGD